MRRKQAVISIMGLFFVVSISILLLNSRISYLGQGMRSFFKQCGAVFSGQGSEDIFTVKRVIDGDTFELENGADMIVFGKIGEKVRYIGIDTPESVKPGVSVQCFAKEAALFNKFLVEGKRIYLRRDVSDRDRYGRLLRYVYLEDGTFVNEVLVREGYAFAASFPPDIAEQDMFQILEREARNAKRGLWADGACEKK